MFRTKLRRAAIAPPALDIPKPVFADSIVELLDEKADYDFPEQFMEQSEPDPVDVFSPWQLSVESALGHLLKLLRLRSLGCNNLKIARTFKAPDERDSGYKDEAREILVFTKFPSTQDRSIYKFADDIEGKKFLKCYGGGDFDFLNDDLWYQEACAAFIELLRVLAQEGVAMDVCCFFELFGGHNSPVGRRAAYLERLGGMMCDSLDINVWFGTAVYNA